MLRIPLLIALIGVGVPAQTQPVVLHNARVYTVDSERPTAEALAFEAGEILAVGSDADVLAAYPDAQRLDVGGRTVVPGLIDAHGHLMHLAHFKLQADLIGTTSVAEIIERLQAFAADLPEGAWITGRGWDQNDWAARGFTLDAAYAGFMEDTVGSLEVGKRADFVVLSRDIMTVPVGEILETEVVATFLDGEATWGGLE